MHRATAATTGRSVAMPRTMVPRRALTARARGRSGSRIPSRIQSSQHEQPLSEWTTALLALLAFDLTIAGAYYVQQQPEQQQPEQQQSQQRDQLFQQRDQLFQQQLQQRDQQFQADSVSVSVSVSEVRLTSGLQASIVDLEAKVKVLSEDMRIIKELLIKKNLER